MSASSRSRHVCTRGSGALIFAFQNRAPVSSHGQDVPGSPQTASKRHRFLAKSKASELDRLRPPGTRCARSDIEIQRPQSLSSLSRARGNSQSATQSIATHTTLPCTKSRRLEGGQRSAAQSQCSTRTTLPCTGFPRTGPAPLQLRALAKSSCPRLATLSVRPGQSTACSPRHSGPWTLRSTTMVRLGRTADALRSQPIRRTPYSRMRMSTR